MSTGYIPVRLTTNSFPIERLPTAQYFQYDVFNPAIEFRTKKNQLFQHLQTKVAPEMFHPRLIYDSQAIAFSPKRIPLAGSGSGTFCITLASDRPVPPGTRGAHEIRLNLSVAEPINVNNVNDLIKGGQSTPRALVATNLMQLVMRQHSNMNYANNGRAYFTEKGKLPVPGSGLELWPGIFHSVRPTLGKMVLTIDTATSAVYKSGPLLNICLDYLHTTNVAELRYGPEEANFKRLEKFLKNLRIKVKTGEGRSRIKTIKGLIARAGEYRFEKDGGEITVERHFNEAHGIRITHPRILGVRLTGRKAAHQDVVPLELCTVEPGQLFKKKFPEDLTAAMVKFATLKPDAKLNKISVAVQEYHRSEFVIESGMALGTSPIIIPGKRLNPPMVKFKGPPLRFEGGAWNVVRQNFHTAKAFHYWIVVNFCPSISNDSCVGMMRHLSECCSKLGMDMMRPYAILQGNSGNAVQDLNRAIDQARPLVDKDKARDFLSNLMIIVLLPENAGSLRSKVKYWGDVDKGFATQCLRENKVKRANDQYWNNIALKINARLGGTNSITTSPVLKDLQTEKDSPFMIMGADVGHPGPGVQKPSFTSLVFSHDMNASHYAALTGIQPPRMEIIEELQTLVYKAVDAFCSKIKGPVRRIIFFRDGVSEGEYARVAQREIAEIKAAVAQLWQKNNVRQPLPTITFIIVGKRHHSVFFPQRGEGDSRTGNCLPGTLVDSNVTHPVGNDFYLQSHAAIQGTCRSSHYVVLLDENFGNNLQKIEELSYTLCHVYAKATRSVSIPAPVYYADLVCSRGMFHIDPESTAQFDDSASSISGQSVLNMEAWSDAFKPTNTSLDKKMYFL